MGSPQAISPTEQHDETNPATHIACERRNILKSAVDGGRKASKRCLHLQCSGFTCACVSRPQNYPSTVPAAQSENIIYSPIAGRCVTVMQQARAPYATLWNKSLRSALPRDL